jgi:SUN domain-containing protein 1/2
MGQLQSEGNSNLKSLQKQLKDLNNQVTKKLSEFSVKTLEKRYQDLSKEIQGLTNRLEKIELLKAEAQPAYDQGTLEEQVRAALDHLLPPLLVGQLDKKSGKVDIHPHFWTFLSQEFVSKSSLKDTLGKEVESLKQDFLVHNSDAVAQVSKASVNELVQSQVLVTKDFVLKMIQDELKGLSAPNSTLEEKIKTVAQKAVSELTEGSSSPVTRRNVKKNTGYSIRDFALVSLGTRVVPSKTSSTFSIPYRSSLLRWASKLLKVEQRVNIKGPETALNPSLSPGQCWAMTGSRGKLTLEFMKPVSLDGIGIEHVSPEEVQSITSAVKDFQIWAYPSQEGQKKELLGEFRFDPLVSSGRMAFDLDGLDESRKWKQIEVLVLTNWGHSEYTCLYKVKVFGH